MGREDVNKSVWTAVVVAGVTALMGSSFGYNYYRSSSEMQWLASQPDTNELQTVENEAASNENFASLTANNTEPSLSMNEGISGQSTVEPETQVAGTKVPSSNTETFVKLRVQAEKTSFTVGQSEEVEDFERQTTTVQSSTSPDFVLLNARAAQFELASVPSPSITRLDPGKKQKSVRGYVGLGGGFTHTVEPVNYASIIKSHVEKFRYNLENSKLLSQGYSYGTEFSLAAFGGIEIGNHWQLETGVFVYRSTANYRSVYQNLIREEFTTIEWVATGETNGPNGQPVFKPVEREDYVYTQKTDTFNSAATTYQVELPLVVRYYWNINRFKVFGGVGTSAQVYGATEVRSEHTSSGQVISTRDSQSGMIQLNALISAGAAFDLGSGFELRAEPVFKPAIYGNNQVLEGFNSNSMHLNFGLSYRF